MQLFRISTDLRIAGTFARGLRKKGLGFRVSGLGFRFEGLGLGFGTVIRQCQGFQAEFAALLLHVFTLLKPYNPPYNYP